MRLLYVVHGFPPRETAGTEQHVAALAAGMAARGHAVQVLAATRAPGRTQYSRIQGPGVTWIVNNLVARPLSQAEHDPGMKRILEEEARRFRPDLVHVHHLQFLSTQITWPSPALFTFHDGWSWCAAGGQSLLPSGARCPGPSPEQCAPCAAAWAPVEGPAQRRLVGLAGRLAPWIAPERLHRLYQRLPPALRLPTRRGVAPAAPKEAAARNAAMAQELSRYALRLAPSRFLADAAAAQGLGPVHTLSHGVPAAALPHQGGGGLLFLGTLARHKGPDLVVAAWRRAFPDGAVPLRFFGPMGEAGLVPDALWGGVLDRAGVAAALSQADALVLGSRWAENAPLVVLEARAAGCPVVAPALGGLPELIGPEDGLLVPPDDEAAMAAALITVLGRRWKPRPPPGLQEMLDETEALYRAQAR
jgi:glycosyltransferase involved in cell wall biosynthesis